MRSIDNLRDEINALKGSASLMKWLGVANAVGAIVLGVAMLSMTVFLLFMLAAMIICGIWNGHAARIQRLREEIAER